MITIFFFYGLAFVLMGIFVFAMPKKNDLLRLSDGLWLVGLFGVTHGLNEWIDLFILRGKPFDIEILKVIGALILPLSFVFLIIFGAKTIIKRKNAFRWLNFIWIVCLLIWAATYYFTKSFLISGIIARYFICIPGAFLTAFALHTCLKHSDKQLTPKVVHWGGGIVVITFLVYGVLGGLIVPKANFFPASVINYSNFSNLIGAPVQLFRMICAIILGVCFFIITKYYFFKGRRIKIRGGIGSKVTMIIIGVAISVVILSVVSGYYAESKLLKKTIGENYEKIAELLAISVDEKINECIEDIVIAVSNTLSINTINESNLKYLGMTTEDINNYFIEMDKKWSQAPLDSALVKEYLEKDISANLIKAITSDQSLKELFITDSFGGVVASTGKTSDFYQADEEWWQVAFNENKIYIGSIEFDQSSSTWGLTFAFPISDGKGQVIGVAKAIANAKLLFSFLEEFKMGKTGHIVLVNQEGYIIYSEKKISGIKRFYKDKSFKDIINGLKRWSIVESPYDNKKDLFVAYADIKQLNILDNGHKWKIFINQELAEVYLPLKELAVKRTLPMLGLIIILIPVGFIYGRIFTKPITKLGEIVESIGQGNLDAKINIKTGDEIENLANSFIKMVSDLKVTTTSIDRLNKEIIERKKVEAEIESLSKFPSEDPNPILRIARNGKILYQNEATYNILRMLNLPKEDVSAIIPKNYISLTTKSLDQKKVFNDVEVNLKNKTYSYSITPVVDAGYVNFYGRDITKRKRAEEKNQELLQFLNERVKEIKCLYNLSKLNDIPDITIEEIFKKSADRIPYGWQYSEITCARIEVDGKEFKSDNFKLTKWKQSENIVVKGNKVGVIEVFYLEEKPEADEGPFLKEERDLIRVIAESLGRDIEYRKSENEIKKAAEEWQRTFDSISDFVFIQDKNSVIIRVNKSFAAAMKAKSEDIIGKKCYEVVHKRDTFWPGCPFQDMVKKGEAYSKEVDDPVIGIPLLITVSPIFDNGKNLIGAVHIAKDISERRRLEKLKDEFVSTVSHELRTPLSIIKEGVSLVFDGIPGEMNEKQKNILRMSSENIDRLARIINNLLDISKIEAGKSKLNKSMVNIGNIIKNACKEWKSESDKKKQDLNYFLPEKELNIFVDSDKITQILDNLISNAIKYTSLKGQIKIEVTDDKKNIQIVVSDTGQGISKEDLPKMFSKFQQFGRVSGPGAKGTGLGLAITKNLVEEHGGTIKVESKFNKGTKFTVLLPKSANT